MIATKTLVGLACLIANKGLLNTSGLETQLTDQEKVQVQAVVDSGACLPENLEQLLKDTEAKIREGKIENMSYRTNPTEGCFKGN